jgi:hypothetical protein
MSAEADDSAGESVVESISDKECDNSAMSPFSDTRIVSTLNQASSTNDAAHISNTNADLSTNSATLSLIQCYGCGKRVKASSKFCKHCGSRLKKDITSNSNTSLHSTEAVAKPPLSPTLSPSSSVLSSPNIVSNLSSDIAAKEELKYNPELERMAIDWILERKAEIAITVVSLVIQLICLAHSFGRRSSLFCSNFLNI